MGNYNWFVLRFSSIIIYSSLVKSYLLSDDGIDQCGNLCVENFFLSQDKQFQVDCQRGCRFFFLIDLQNTHELNKSSEECLRSCEESYFNIQQRKSCGIGCDIVLKRAENLLRNNLEQGHTRNDCNFGTEYNEFSDTNHGTFNFEEMIGDWLECASNNSGIPKWLLIFAIFVAIFAVVLLSFSSEKAEFENETTKKSSKPLLLGSL